MPTPAEARARVAGLFDTLAPVYDQGPVPWFTPMGARLVELVQPTAGEHVLDIGAGRGAVAFPLCEAVGPTGSVTAVDLSPAMVSHLSADAAQRGVTNLEIRQGTAGPNQLAPSSYDLVTASMVLFFDPTPEATLADWLALLRPGGRIGLTTFGGQDAAWRAAELLLVAYAPAIPDPRTNASRPPFTTIQTMTSLLSDCGLVDVECHDEPLEIVLPDVRAWRQWSMSLGLRQFWDMVPAAEQDDLMARIGEVLEADRGPDGQLHLTQQVRYSTGRAI